MSLLPSTFPEIVDVEDVVKHRCPGVFTMFGVPHIYWSTSNHQHWPVVSDWTGRQRDFIIHLTMCWCLTRTTPLLLVGSRSIPVWSSFSAGTCCADGTSGEWPLPHSLWPNSPPSCSSPPRLPPPHLPSISYCYRTGWQQRCHASLCPIFRDHRRCARHHPHCCRACLRCAWWQLVPPRSSLPHLPPQHWSPQRSPLQYLPPLSSFLPMRW